MAQEVEVKILDIDPAQIRTKLKELHAEFIKDVLQKNSILLNEYTKKNNVLLRLRDEGNDITVTVKSDVKEVDGMKVANEYEFHVKDKEMIHALFQTLGFEEWAYYEKKREYYKIDGCSVEIIFFPQLNPFLELEGDREKIDLVAKKLGYSEENYSAHSIFELHDMKGQRYSFNE